MNSFSITRAGAHLTIQDFGRFHLQHLGISSSGAMDQRVLRELVKVIPNHKNQFLYISKGFAHGYKTLENNTSILYKVSNFYSPRNELTLNYLDSNIKIDWNSNSKRSLSKKDLNGMSLEEITKYL